MRKYILLVLIFILTSCSLGQKHARQSAIAPTDAPTQATASNNIQQSAGKHDAKSAPTNAPSAPSALKSQSSTLTFVPGSSGAPGLSDPGTVGHMSVTYSSNLGLWFMTYDGGRQSKDTTGIYFTYASAPWGQWATPQLIFNACRDHGFGNFIYYSYDKSKPNDNICPSVTSAGPAGPTAGDQTKNVPTQTRGVVYAPEMIGRFTEIQGNTLKIYYLMSTWNPYTNVLMSSEFKISQTP